MSIIGAKVVHGAEPMQPFTAEAGSQTAPTVDFGTMGGAPAQPAANDNVDQQAPAAGLEVLRGTDDDP